MAGRPWSVTISLGASDGRALRVRRCSQESRQCARLARVKTLSGGTAPEGGSDWGKLAQQMVWPRTTLSHPRRMPQRGQSCHSTGARAGGAGASGSVGAGETAEREEGSGQYMALTRRGLIVALLS